MFRLFLCSVLLLLILPYQATALLRIDITQGHLEPLPIALPAFPGDSPELNAIGRDIAGVIGKDLQNSGLFRSINPQAFIEPITLATATPRFPDWRAINAQALLIGKVTSAGGGEMVVSFRLWDIFAGEQIAGREFTAPRSSWRRIAHIIADIIYNRLTGETGIFDSRIVYVAETGPANRRIKRLAIMDQDGANHTYLTSGRHLVLTPRFSPSFREIVYFSYARGKPHVRIRDLETGREDTLNIRGRMSFAPRFSRDGSRVAMSISRNGNSEIHVMDMRTRRMQQLTRHPAIDTAPSFSPDGRRIVFESNRGGKQQLYVMNADGGNQHRISFGKGRYASPIWSPRGDKIAFTKIHKGKFHIGVMRPDGTRERTLTGSYSDESPSWSPNGRVIVFSRQERPNALSSLYSIDVTGRNLRRLPTPRGASDPAWSPLSPH